MLSEKKWDFVFVCKSRELEVCEGEHVVFLEVQKRERESGV